LGSEQKSLTTQTKTIDQITVALDFFYLQIIQQTAALIDHSQQTAAGMVIMLV
jgi:hypothetical protein